MEKKLEVELKGVSLTEQQTNVLMPLLVQHMQRRIKRSKFEARAVAMLAGAGCPLKIPAVNSKLTPEQVKP